MLEGVVRVEQNNSPATAHPATNIAAGDQLVADSVREVRVRKANPERLTSWRNGRLIFDNTRLADAVAEMNRYSEVKIQLKDATLKELRLSGGFDTGRQDVFVDAVTNYFPARVSQTDERTITLVVQ
jgi:transmembrane sensor